MQVLNLTIFEILSAKLFYNSSWHQSQTSALKSHSLEVTQSKTSILIFTVKWEYTGCWLQVSSIQPEPSFADTLQKGH